MEQIKRRAGRPAGREASQVKTFRLRDEDAQRLTALKELWGCSEVAVIRRLLLEAARREEVAEARTASKAAARPLAPRQRGEETGKAGANSDRPIWEELVEIADQASREDPTPLPSDLAEQHDHYIYGTPKR